jgi:hypothetical protein
MVTLMCVSEGAVPSELEPLTLDPPPKGLKEMAHTNKCHLEKEYENRIFPIQGSYH